MRKIACVMAAIVIIAGCGDSGGKPESGKKESPKTGKTETFAIVSGSENQGLEPLIHNFARNQGVKIKIDYAGSVDMTISLSEQGAKIPYDAVWPANSLWLTLGDTNKVVRHPESIMRSPVVLGVKKQIAERLGWIDKPVSVSDILTAAESGMLRFAMTSATQSNSGCSAYFGFLYAMAGSPDMLQDANIEDPEVQRKVRSLLSKVDRSSGSSGWLKDNFVAHYDRFQAMFNYEAMIIEANQKLIETGKTPVYAIYPTDGIMIADSPLGYVDKGNAQKEALFNKLQAFLLSDEVQAEIMKLGRRTGLIGLNAESADKRIFNPEWGIDISRIISPVPTPAEPVIRNALSLYQVALRKPSCTAYVVDISGSMEGGGLEELKSALTLILDIDQAKRYMLQPSARDITMIIPFNSQPRAGLKATGNDPETMGRLFSFVQGLKAGGGTNIYAAASKALAEISAVNNIEEYFPAVILMTDGRSEGDISMLRKTIETVPGGSDIPIFSITFGKADEAQLKEISETTIGRVFKGSGNLVSAFRNAKGYN